MDTVMRLGSQNAVVIFTKSSCCMCHAVKRLFYELGVSPAIYELDKDPRGREMEAALISLGLKPSVPAVFIGGHLLDSTNTVMALHLNGSLVPMLKQAGAMWLYYLLRKTVIEMEAVNRLASQKGVVIFSKSSCCMCYAVKILFHELKVNPIVHELDLDPDGREMERALSRMGSSSPLPAVFINGNFVGSTNEVMSLHLSGSLIPKLKPYQNL
ncbi:hypothetical protein Sjap_006765 [Stephania japonica]|uniref:Glutaredoxin domain-containing protein n=1 Tax=Stephania japonica TaxID=461633 RepID=A0AAP0K6H8_9MAGN